MLYEVNNVVYGKQETIGVCLENLKQSPRDNSCNMQMDGYRRKDGLYEMTAQGKNGGILLPRLFERWMYVWKHL